MTTRIDTYAVKETAVEAVRFEPGDTAFRLLDEWSKGHVFKHGENAVLLEGHDSKRVRITAGDYIVKVSEGCFYRFTEPEMREHYIRTEGLS